MGTIYRENKLKLNKKDRIKLINSIEEKLKNINSRLIISPSMEIYSILKLVSLILITKLSRILTLCAEILT